MQRELDRLATYLDQDDRHVEDVSAWSIHKQVEHTALVARQILQLVAGLESGAMGERGGWLRWPGHLVLALGWIPRGKGVAPKALHPADTPDPDVVRGVIAEIRALHPERRPRRGGPRAAHPHFGPMTARQWARFLRIHTRHHLRIIRDIGRRAHVTARGPR